MKKKEVQETEETINKFTKEKLLLAKKYEDKKDIVNALLLDNKEYCFDEVDVLIEDFMNRKVGN